jgi:cytochrome c-type biogenesis protein CcmE
MKFLAVVAFAYAAFCMALFAFQRSLIYFPQPREVTAPQSTMILPVEDAKLVVTVRLT